MEPLICVSFFFLNKMFKYLLQIKAFIYHTLQQPFINE